MNVLETENICKNFGEFRAVNEISFSLKAGTIFGLLGPNGAGKTTTIRMVMNIIIPDSGRISVLGETISTRLTDKIGYLPEERGLYRKMKVGELLIFLTRLKSMQGRKAKQEIDFWLERFGLGEWKNKKVEELSKGMQQKLQFLGAVIHDPKLLILDEPFGGLDPINTDFIKNELLELKRRGTTIIFSTHVMESAEKLCEEIFLINKGSKVLHGKLADIKRSFGRQNVLIEFEGSEEFLRKSSQIKKYDYYGNTAEIQLAKGGDTQKLLREAIDSASIRKFELQEPSLHDIFIESVSRSNSGVN